MPLLRRKYPLECSLEELFEGLPRTRLFIQVEIRISLDT